MINGKRLVWLAGLLAGVALCIGCDRAPRPTPGSPETPDSATPDLVVAEDRLGAITAADLDRFILDLPPDKRWQSDVEPVEWYAQVARRVAVNRLLVEQATLAGADQDPQFQVRQRRIERQVATDHYLSGLPDEEPLTVEELRAFYDQHREERYERPERRQTFHIFKRFTGGERAPVLTALEQLRQRALAGESFAQLARRHSDSESRHRDGEIGPVERGQHSADFDRVVFALEEGVPSEPMITADGAHLFYVARVFEARSLDFEEVRRAILQELTDERERQRLALAAAELPLPEDRFIPEPDEVAGILRLGDRAAVLLRLGDFELTAGQFQELFAARRSQLGGKHVPDLGSRLLEEVRYREVIYQHLLREGFRAGPSGRSLGELPREEIARLQHRELVEHFAQRQMVSHLERQPERIQRHYSGNAMRFSTPVKVQMTQLTVPLSSDPAALMAELEAAVAELDAGRLRLAGLAERHGGKVRTADPLTAAQLQALDPGALRFAFQLEPGKHSPPYQREAMLAMFRVDERQPAEPRPLATVWDQVVQDYLAHYSPQLFEELSTQLLEDAGFRLYRDRLASLGPMLGS